MGELTHRSLRTMPTGKEPAGTRRAKRKKSPHLPHPRMGDKEGTGLSGPRTASRRLLIPVTARWRVRTLPPLRAAAAQ